MHDSTTNTQSFLAIQYLAGGSFSSSWSPDTRGRRSRRRSAIMEGYDNDQYSIRLRLMYSFLAS